MLSLVTSCFQLLCHLAWYIYAHESSPRQPTEYSQLWWEKLILQLPYPVEACALEALRNSMLLTSPFIAPLIATLSQCKWRRSPSRNRHLTKKKKMWNSRPQTYILAPIPSMYIYTECTIWYFQNGKKKGLHWWDKRLEKVLNRI